MLSDQPYLQSWRPVYELSSAVLWFTSMNTALCLSFFSPLPLSGFLATGTRAKSLGLVKKRQYANKVRNLNGRTLDSWHGGS